MNKQDQQNLFILMDENYEKYYVRNGVKKTFWRELHALDQDLVKGGIRMETFNGQPAKDMRGNRDTADTFFPGTETIVLEFKNPKAVLEGADLLNHIFLDTKRRFVPEIVERNGEKHYQIRSNLNKEMWGQLSVFCKYRMDREITKQSERDTFKKECQGTVDHYIRKTDCESWDAVEGMPAFVTLMGLHGNLRPSHRYPADARRKSEELNSDERIATLRDITIHVDLDRKGDIHATTPYSLGFNVHRAAWQGSHEESLTGIGLEATFTSNPFSKHLPLSNRILKAGGFAAGVMALAFGETTPAIIGITSGMSGILVGYFHKHWEVLGHMKRLQQEHPELFNSPAMQMLEQQKDGGFAQTTDVASISKTDQLEMDRLVKEALTGQKLAELKALTSTSLESEMEELSPSAKLLRSIARGDANIRQGASYPSSNFHK